MATSKSMRVSGVLLILVMLVSLFSTAATPTASVPQATKPIADKMIFFAADGLRQDLVAEYVKQGQLPQMGELLKKGASAADWGLLTQAPPNTGAGWYSLATGAWPAVTGSTNNTFHKVGAAFNTRTAAFDPGVLQAESLAQAAERGGKKVAQVEWAGGRNAAIQGPTVDYRSFFSGRGVVTNYIAPEDMANFVTAFGLQFDHPAGFAGLAPYAQAEPVPAVGWTNVPKSKLPAKEMRMRVLDFGTDKYGMNAYIFASKNGSYDSVLFSFTKDGTNGVILKKGEWGDVKVTISGGAMSGKTGGMLIKVEELTGNLSKVRLFHTSVTRAIASWPGWTDPNFVGDFEDFIAEKFPTSTAADYAILEAGIVSEETYVEQGLYWEKLYLPLIDYIMKTYAPDLMMAGYPATDEFQHQFLGLVTEYLPNGEPNPAYDDVQVNGTPDGRVKERKAFLLSAYKGADKTLGLIRKLMPNNTTTFVAADHGFAPQFLAIDASKVLVDLGLLSKPQTSNCRPASGETIGKAKACWAGGTVQIYLNLEGRDPAGGGFVQIPANQEMATVNMIKAAFEALADPYDWTGDGNPEGWMVIDRVYTRAEARYIPNGPDSTSNMAHPTRSGDVIAFSYPPYQFDAATPGTLVALSAFFGQHGYVPDVQVLEANVNMRAGFLAGGKGIAKGKVADLATIDLAPTAAFLMGVPMPQHAQGRVRLDMLRGASRYSYFSAIGLTDFHGQITPTTFSIDGRNIPVGGAAYLATMFDEEAAYLPGETLLLSSGDLVGAAPPISGLLEDMPTIYAANAWGLVANAYGNHEFDYGQDRLKMQQAAADFPFLAVNIVEEATGKAPDWVTPSIVKVVNGIKVGIIGVGYPLTPELVSAGATEGLMFLDPVVTARAESERLRDKGVRVQIVLYHDGSSRGANTVDGVAGIPWEGPLVDFAVGMQGTTVDVIMGGHTHRTTNFTVGNILVLEGINAGTSYHVSQMVVNGGDVIWAGGANRLAVNLGVAQRPDVKAIVDDANAQTAVLRNKVIGTQQFDIKRAPSRLFESAMGNMVADAMWAKYPGVEASFTNSGGLRADLNCSPPSAGEADCEITWGEVFAVLPFGNRTVLVTLNYAQLETALLNGVLPKCNSAISTGRFPQVAGFRFEYHCNGLVPVIDGIWKTPMGMGGPEYLMGSSDTLRFVTNDFMYTGGDGFTSFILGADPSFPGDDLMELTVEYIGANSPVGPVVEGRIKQNP
jgi:2',3'-cyclic-nucleotide 2'-phosphodiesterase (5'-nucleotidase family)